MSHRISSALIGASRLLVILPLVAVNFPAGANEVVYDCTLDAKASSVVQGTSITAPFAGTLIGDYNAKTNPTGTQTRPGLFGGSGNQPIPYTASFALDGDINSNPSGGFTASVDTETLQAAVNGLEIDLLGGGVASLPATLNINYATFRTFTPNSFFPGGVTIPVPIGDANITQLRAIQSGTATGVLVAQKGGGYAINVVVPVDLVLSADVLGAPFAESAVIPGALPLVGSVSIDGNAVGFALAITDSSEQTQPIKAGGFANQPIALPTVIPTGSTANLLISGTVTEVSVSSSIDATIVALGTRAAVLGDLNGDYVVNATDAAIILNNWGGAGEGDINGDGVVGPADLAVVLNGWT
jgi:hypothetical protein